MRIENYKDLSFANKKFMDLKSKLVNKKSDAESHFEDLLKKSGMFYIREKCNFKLSTLWCYYDFYIPRLRLYVEIDGIEHSFDRQKKIDVEKESYVRKKGCYIIRYSNEYVLSLIELNPNILLNTLFEKVKRNRYYTNIVYVRKTQDEDIKTLFENRYNGEVWLYCHLTGQYYSFKNISKCCAYTSLKPTYVYELLDTVYKKSNSRKYVLAKTLSECENNVLATFS